MKPWYRSRTLWVNVFAAFLLGVEANLNLIQPFMPFNFYQIMAVLLPVINLLLRSITNTGLNLVRA